MSLFLVWNFAKEKWKVKEIGDNNKKPKKNCAHSYLSKIFPFFELLLSFLERPQKKNLGILNPIKEKQINLSKL